MSFSLTILNYHEDSITVYVDWIACTDIKHPISGYLGLIHNPLLQMYEGETCQGRTVKLMNGSDL